MESGDRRSAPSSPEPCDGEAMEAVSDLMRSLSDKEMLEKIERLRSLISSNRSSSLPDKGKRIVVQLQQLKDEQERRRNAPARVVNEVLETCERVSLSKCAGSSGSAEHCSANQKLDKDSPSSFVKAFDERFLQKEVLTSRNDDIREAAAEKCKNIIKNNIKEHNIKEHIERKEKEASKLSMQQQSTVSCRDAPFKSVVQISSGEKSTPVKNCDGASTHLENNSSSVSAKRKRGHENDNSAKSTSKKEVVLLDIDSQAHRENSIEWEESRCYYPSREHPEMVELTPSDVNCLEPEQYLSSTVMNFYIVYLQRTNSPIGAAANNCYFFNTYFYNKLEEYASPKGNKRLSFLKLRRWWKGVNLFQKAYIFMPVYGDMHWSLVIICIPPEDDNSGPMVLHLDSLDYHRSIPIFDNINKYLKEEWTYIDHNTPDKSEIPISQKIWNNLPRRIENKVVKVPQQANEYDCGLFVLYFMERFIEKAPKRLRRKDLSMFGIKWFQTVDASALRHRIRCLLIDVFDKANLENGKPESTSNLDSGKPGSTSNLENDEPESTSNSEDGKPESTSKLENDKTDSASSEEVVPCQKRVLISIT